MVRQVCNNLFQLLPRAAGARWIFNVLGSHRQSTNQVWGTIFGVERTEFREVTDKLKT